MAGTHPLSLWQHLSLDDATNATAQPGSLRRFAQTDPEVSPASSTAVSCQVEDALSCVWESFVVPMFHVTRLGFGLSLLFYGMAFRTFAFHVIVFRIAGFKQVRTQ